MKKAGSVLRTTKEQLEIMMQNMILDNLEHPLHKTTIQRLLQFCCSTDRYRYSFLVKVIRIYNNSLKNLR